MFPAYLTLRKAMRARTKATWMPGLLISGRTGVITAVPLCPLHLIFHAFLFFFHFSLTINFRLFILELWGGGHVMEASDRSISST